MAKTIYKNIIFDFDSTLVSIEGLDELAKNHNKFDEIAKITNSGMNGDLSFNSSLKTRFALLAPSLKDLEFLTEAYKKSIVSGAKEVISEFQNQGSNVFILTGGLKEAILPVTKLLGVKKENVFAVCTSFDIHGNLILKDSCLMTKDQGKIEVVKKLRKLGPTVVIGDGMTDLEAGKHADKFIGFGGIIQRERVKSLSEHYFTEPSLYKLLELC